MVWNKAEAMDNSIAFPTDKFFEGFGVKSCFPANFAALFWRGYHYWMLSLLPNVFHPDHHFINTLLSVVTAHSPHYFLINHIFQNQPSIPLKFINFLLFFLLPLFILSRFSFYLKLLEAFPLPLRSAGPRKPIDIRFVFDSIFTSSTRDTSFFYFFLKLGRSLIFF